MQSADSFFPHTILALFCYYLFFNLLAILTIFRIIVFCLGQFGIVIIYTIDFRFMFGFFSINCADVITIC